jgi:hypothetical protein
MVTQCDYLETGDSYSSWGRTTVCVDLYGPDTMREVKTFLYAATGARTDIETPTWTPNDEAVLQSWAYDEPVADPDVMRDGPLGWKVPSGYGVEKMAEHIEIWEQQAAYPLLTLAKQEADAHWFSTIETTDPEIGQAAGAPAEEPDADEPVPSGEEPRSELPSDVIQSRPVPPPTTASSASYRNIGVAVAAVGILAAVAYYMRG